MKNKNGFICKKIDDIRNEEEQRKQEYQKVKSFAPKGQIQFIRKKEDKNCVLGLLKSGKRIPTCNLCDDYLIIAYLIEPNDSFLFHLGLKDFSYCSGFKKDIRKNKKAGNPKLKSSRNQDTTKARQKNIDKANQYKNETLKIIQKICSKYKLANDKYTAIASKLNFHNYKTRLGNLWNYKTVKRLLEDKEEQGKN